MQCDDLQVASLAREAGLPEIIARLLVLRGIQSAQDARAFMDPTLDHLHDPSLLPDLDAGVDRLHTAIESGEKILIHGDYDVDGVTSTALLVRSLRALKAEVAYRLPHRRKDGYGIKPAVIGEAAKLGAKVIVTCDCGITACDTAEAAHEAGIDLVITDHHEPSDELPRATAVIDPKREDALYPFPELAGVGVAMKLAQGLVRKLGYDDAAYLSRFTDLAALGTVGDVVPLLGENRSIVKHGLLAMSGSKKIGLRTMLRSAGLEGKVLTAYYLGFVLGPRINAAGRMADATSALRLLLTTEEPEAVQLTTEMERHNAERRAEQERIVAEAMELAEPKVAAGSRVLVLSKEGWNRGIVGIVASKICECFGRPAILISRDEAKGIGGGSARSVPEFSMIDALRQCADLLVTFGGHMLAAGVTVDLVKLDEFEERINSIAFEAIPEEELLPRIDVDAELGAESITRELATALASMEPFGTGNPEPLFVTRNLALAQKQRVGDGSHLKFQVRANGQPAIDCIGFGLGDFANSLQLGSLVDLCYNVRFNTFNGYESVQLVAKDIRESS